MAKSATEKYYKKIAKIKKRGKRRYIVSIIALITVILVGGTFLALLIHLELNGMLSGIATLLKAFLVSKDVDVTLIVFWLVVIPLVLILILIVNVIRRKRFKYYMRTWEETAEVAIAAEREAYEAKKEKLAHTKRFSALNDISPAAVIKAETINSLKQLCDDFRNYAASKLHLYYTESQIRVFISSLAVSKILILQGMSGTGKTSLAYAFGEYIGNPSTIVPVQPMWKERSDLLGYYNEFTKKYNETLLLRTMYEANESEAIYITVLDEMNIARVEYYFAEFLSLLEIPNPELRYLEVVSDVWEDDPSELKNGRIKLPENMWFIGTANNDDSTFSISDKVYDRAMVVNLETRTRPFKTDGNVCNAGISYKQFVELAEHAQYGYEITKRNERRLKELDEYLISKFHITFGNRIMRQIRSYISVYVACGGDELDALDDILCKKVFRKLTYKDLSLMRKELNETSKFLETLFGEGKMPSCREFLARVARS